MKFAILGTGIMGRGWITQCAMSGHDVHCFDASAQTLAVTVTGCEKLAATVAKKFKNTDLDFVSKVTEKIIVHTEKGEFIDAAKGCDVFLEVIFEDLKLKCSVLAEFLPQLPESWCSGRTAAASTSIPWPRLVVGRNARSLPTA